MPKFVDDAPVCCACEKEIRPGDAVVRVERVTLTPYGPASPEQVVHYHAHHAAGADRAVEVLR